MNKIHKLGLLAVIAMLFGFSSLHAQAVLDGVVFNEILPDPNSSTNNFDTDGDGNFETADEFIELYNTTGMAVDVSNWELWDGSVAFVIPGGTSIPANGYLVLVGGYAPNTPPANYIIMGGSLSNGGDDLILYNPTSNMYIGMEYGGGTVDDSDVLTAYPTATSAGADDFGNDTDGLSIQRIPDGAASFSNETPTPLATNMGNVICEITGEFVDNATCNGDDFVFEVGFTASNGSGSYKVVDVTNTMDLATGVTMSPVTVTIPMNSSTTPFDILVEDEADNTCQSGTITVTPQNCVFTPSCINVGDLVISEIMANPASSTNDDTGEWFEVYNTTANPVDIQGYQIGDNTNPLHTISQPVVIPAMGYVVLGRDGDNTMNGGYTPDYVYSGFGLNNSGDALQIVCPGTGVIDIVDYTTGFNIPNGASMSLDPASLDASSNDDGANWCASPSTTLTEGDDGTPGTANMTCPMSSCPSSGDLVITEFMADPNPPIAADNGEYFEVYNTTSADIDMQGMVIKDDGTDSHTIGSSLIVPAGGYAVLGKNADMATNGGITVDYAYPVSYALASGDEIVIECEGIEIDRVNYTSSWPGGNGVSASLDPNSLDATSNDDQTNWCDATSTTGMFVATPGAANDSCGSTCPDDITETGATADADLTAGATITINSNMGETTTLTQTPVVYDAPCVLINGDFDTGTSEFEVKTDGCGTAPAAQGTTINE